ncbi:hypothetical protein [Paraglaciecola arctica]|uniref:Uncharacterized protein n=1 Tax=Paraglaciecola arctica BSs20135 TaxID=493475 RepID=K6XIN7_9ALTE|nr:hypothetical protein [Paraglaciecola arctica]GAC20519.1 hypothetical protein GARC_3565 [Paraglaciecola arctica BSs20135]
MLNFKLKISVLLAALTSISLQAQDYEVADTLPQQTQLEVTKTEAQEPVTADTSIQESKPEPAELDKIPETLSPTCPTDFYTLPLYPNAKFCQLFAQGLPASMSYFTISDPQSAKEFYINQLGQAEDQKMLKGRIVLQYSNGQKVIVISKDGQGSQIDILVKSTG